MVTLISDNNTEINSLLDYWISWADHKKKKFRLIEHDGHRQITFEQPGRGNRPTFDFDRLKPYKTDPYDLKKLQRKAWEKPGFIEPESTIHNTNRGNCPRCQSFRAFEGCTYRLCRNCGKIYNR